MKKIESVALPASYSESRAQKLSFDDMVYQKNIRIALWEQQNGFCAYCERKLRHPNRHDHRTRIEHFHPRACTEWAADCKQNCSAKSATDSITHWSNLLLCCDGNEFAKQDLSCDASKKDLHICQAFRNPKTTQLDSLIEISNSGSASPVSGLPEGAAEVIDIVLNLNSNRFVEARRSVITSWKKKSNGKLRASGTKKQDVVRLLMESSGKVEYGSALISIANKIR